ncbi:FAD-binding domain-containing protein [Agrocybe pediades]|nr:FAD-binding domain-containing protein [Agrocybe pediades]
MLLTPILPLLEAFGLSKFQSLISPSGSPVLNQTAWDEIYEEVEGRLFGSQPVARPCFSQSNDDQALCEVFRKNSRTTGYLSDRPSGYVQLQWETCQATSEDCLVDPTDSSDDSTTRRCKLGSIFERYIDVENPNDVSAAFKFSRKTGMPVVIKNSGHDYMGRSSAPGSLMLWMHNLKMSSQSDFVPEGCLKSYPAMTMGAGVQWKDAYEFADQHNFTVVGGMDGAVGAVGGWLQGGGHSPLSNTMGLGVDRVLQFKVVTPDGEYRVANECQNEDLFFALRGGGGGTFGVVMEATVLTSPKVTLQSVLITFNPDVETTKELWSVLIDNGLSWAKDGWGGLSMAHVAWMINPVLNKEEAEVSMAPLLQFGQEMERRNVPGFKLIVTEFPSWGTFFETFTRNYAAVTSASFALSSRLVSKSNLATPERRSELVSGLLAANAATPGLIILITAPSSTVSTGMTSVTEAWRSSLYHVTLIAQWKWNATKAEKRQRYQDASSSIDNLRRITPNAAYVNEADVYEPNHQEAFWGGHYPELLRIKRKYDPEHLLDCWHCVGWNPHSPRFSCYL